MGRTEIEAVEIGSLEEASAAVARLFAVTQAAYERRGQLQRALESRVTIEQAKGILAERYGTSADEAFAAIRRAARNRGIKLHDLAQAVRPGEATPSSIRAVIESRADRF